MRLALNEATVLPCSLETFLEAASEAGFDEVELRLEKLEEFLRGRSVGNMVKLMETSGLELASLNSIENFSLLPKLEFGKLLKRLDRVMGICSEMGCDMVIAVPSPLPPIKKGSVTKRTSEALRSMARAGASHGIGLAFEFLGFDNSSVRTLEEAVKVIAGLDNVGLVFDAFHFYISGGSLTTLRNIPGEKIWMVHLNDVKDSPTQGLKDNDRLLPGEGIMDLGSMIKNLRATGYDGHVSVELFNEEYWRQNPHEVARKGMISLKKLGL